MSLSRSSPRPAVMTWSKASPVLILCGIFDLLRLFFEQFWLFGPALGALSCTAIVSDKVGAAGGLVAAGCTGVAGAAGYFGGPAIGVFGIIMAMAIGLFGWLTIGLLLVIMNARIFKENESGVLLLLLGLGISEMPIVGSLPALTVTTWKLYKTQIKKEREKFFAWQKQQALLEMRQRNEQMAYLQRAHQEQEFVNVETEKRIELERNEEIPEKRLLAA